MKTRSKLSSEAVTFKQEKGMRFRQESNETMRPAVFQLKAQPGGGGECGRLEHTHGVLRYRRLGMRECMHSALCFLRTAGKSNVLFGQ